MHKPKIAIYHSQRTGPQTVTRLAGQRVAGDKGCGFYLPRKDDRRTGPQTVTRLAGQRVAGDKGCGFYLPRKDDRRTGPQTVTRLAGRRAWGRPCLPRRGQRGDTVC